MGLTEIPLASIDVAPWNYRKEEPFLQGQLERNLRRNGQVENLIVREKPGGRYEAVNGNHRLPAMAAAGMEIAVCVNLGKVSDEEAKRVSVETNETRFRPDQVRLAEVVAEAAGEFGTEDLSGTMPFTVEEIGDYASLLEFDWTQFGDAWGESLATSVSVTREVYEELVEFALEKNLRKASGALELLAGGE